MALFKHELRGAFPGEAWSFGVHTLGNITVSAAETAWATATDAFWDATTTLFAPEVTAVATSTAELDQATGKQLTRVETPSSLAGTAATESLPFQCAAAVSWRTALATRAGRGRFYAPSLAVAFVADGRMTSAAQTALLTGAQGMATALSGAGLSLVLYSRTTHATQVITSVDVGDVIDTQRRRRNKLVESRVSANL